MRPAQRLVDNIRPEFYQLSITPDMESFTFDGQETIAFDLLKSARDLTFHVVGLEISSVRLDSGHAGTVAFSEADQTVTFGFEQAIEAGQHTLELTFSGQINDSLHGFYRSQYDHNGETKWLALTQFEAVHAREAFVCIDEPSAKAVFELSLTIPKALTAISNTQIESEKPAGAGRKTVTFAPSPKMSTYLVAYLVGEFEYKERQTSAGTVVRIYATPGKRDQFGFALDTAVRMLEDFTEYFGIAYPLVKLDMIAVPDFGAAAMENWGAIIYRETDLLLDETKTSLSHKQRVALVIAHELAHQWFGNLVTMAWWNDLWLNEGFAAWAETLALDRMFPEWRAWHQFVGWRLEWALRDDALANTHPIEVEVEDPLALDEIFDGISYAKGAGIINMLHHYLGPDDFRRGLKHYLELHQFANATTEDLWRSLGVASGKPVREMMTAWTRLPGYPIVFFGQKMLIQKRFYSSAREAAKATPGQLWPIPFDAITDQGETGQRLITTAEAELGAEISQAEWFKPNPDQSGFYRVSYTPAMIERLAGPLADGRLNATDRLGVVSDVLATAPAGITDSAMALKLIARMHGDENYVVWSKLAAGLGDILGIIDDEGLRRRLEQFGRWFVQPNLARLGWDKVDGESSFDTLLRPLVLHEAVRFDHPGVTAEARRRFGDFHQQGSIDPDLRLAVFYAIARHGEAVEYDTMLEMYRHEQVPQAKRELLMTLCRFRKPELVQRSLELCLSKDVRSQDSVLALGRCLMGHDSRYLAWQFIRDQWDTLVRRYGGGGYMLTRLPEYAGAAFASHQIAEEMAGFFKAHPHPVISRPVAQALEVITLKADWYERDHVRIERFLAEWEGSNLR